MSHLYLYSMKAPLKVQNLLAGLATAGLIKATSCIAVLTDDEQVAALLDKLETSEWIEMAVTSMFTTASTQPKIAEPKPTKPKRQYTSGPLVECNVCHKQKPAAQTLTICKNGLNQTEEINP